MGEAVAVVGAGAIGGFFAAHLAAAGTSVTCCVRTPFETLSVQRADGALVTAEPAVARDPSLVGRADVVLVAVKAHQTPDVAGWLDALVGEGTVVVALQNGVEHLERFDGLVPAGTTVVPSAVYCGVELVEPGRIEHRSNGFFQVAEGPVGERLVELFAGTGAEVRLVDDITTALWQKLCGNVAANGPTALTQRRMDAFAEPAVADLARALVAEAAEVGRAEGAVVPDDLAEGIVAFMARPPWERGTSMLYDRLAGRPLEWDAIYGAVQRAGRRHGLATPHTDAVAALLSAC